MTYFTPDFLHFFAELTENNDRDWFNANKSRYDKSVKKPFEKLVADLIDRLQAIHPSMAITPKDAIFRIYRDTRFSADKTPYKNHTSAIFAPGGKKDFQSPGMYLEMNNEHTRIYSGVYMPDKEVLQRIREAIASEPARFRSLIEAPAFKESYGEIRGDKNKRLPSEFVEAAATEPLLYNKAFYYFHQFPPETALHDDLVELIIAAYLKAKPVSDFLAEAMRG